MNRLVLCVCVMLAAPLSFAGDISGVWRLSNGPAWIEVSLDSGDATVVRNEQFPERVGRKILKGLQADGSKENLWQGQVYAEKQGEYKDAKILLSTPDLMIITVKVGFISRTIEWVRVDALPPETLE